MRDGPRRGGRQTGRDRDSESTSDSDSESQNPNGTWPIGQRRPCPSHAIVLRADWPRIKKAIRVEFASLVVRTRYSNEVSLRTFLVVRNSDIDSDSGSPAGPRTGERDSDGESFISDLESTAHGRGAAIRRTLRSSPPVVPWSPGNADLPNGCAVLQRAWRGRSRTAAAYAATRVILVVRAA